MCKAGDPGRVLHAISVPDTETGAEFQEEFVVCVSVSDDPHVRKMHSKK